MAGTAGRPADDGSSVWLAVVPVERSTLGDLTFEVDRVAAVGDLSLSHGLLSDGQAASFFDCGGFRFGIAGPVGGTVVEVAEQTAAQVETCPADVDELVALFGEPADA